MTVLKSVVVGLTVANVLYFLWTHGVGASSQSLPSAPPSESLKLVSEAIGGTHSAAPELTPAPRLPAPGAAESAADVDAASLLTGVKRCITVGPFRDVGEAAHAASTLRSGGYDPRQRVVEGEVWAGVWVYLPIAQSPAANEQLLGKLKAAGIEDALEMPGPNEESVISLGLFGEQKRAQARVGQLHALGLNPAMADRKRTGNVYWVDIDLKPTDGLLNPADLQGDAGRITRIELKSCPAKAGSP